ncbi:MAG TPA: kelch repeat-containing protein [Blastocatellia bacterium]|nr:kelch repeat-containing protein [Blastocatellia bacterium]
MTAARELPSATLLPNGKVLLAGGEAADDAVGNTAELYDPATESWSPAGTMNAAREGHTATLLPNGRVIVTAGFGGTLRAPALHTSSELYDPATGNWTPTGSLSAVRSFHRAVLLLNGKVLVVSGSNFTTTVYNTAGLYDPATGQWSATGNMAVVRQAHTLTLLPNGQVLVVGKTAGQSGAELYDPATGIWRAAADPAASVRQNHTATLLPSGKVLVTGGNGPLASTELYKSGELMAATVSAASYRLQNSAKAIVAAFGQSFSTATDAATTVPLPTTLAGVSVRVRDTSGAERLAPLFFVSPNQINYQIPEGTISGQAIVTISASDGRSHFGLLDLTSAAPSLFTANQSGTGPAAALDAFTFTAAPFNATRSNGEPNIIAVFGSGLGADVTDADGNVSASVEARIDGQAMRVLYAGRAPGFVGLNQFNLQLPAGLNPGTHTLVISRNSAVSNPVTLETK